MPNTFKLAAILICLAPLPLCALGVKVERVNRQSGRIQVLLPVHSVRIDAEALPEDCWHGRQDGATGRWAPCKEDTADIRVRRGEFYEATIERQDKPVWNVLRIKVPGAQDARYRVLTLRFVE